MVSSSSSSRTTVNALVRIVLAVFMLAWTTTSAEQNHHGENVAATATSQWDKAKHAMGLVRDLLFQVGHDAENIQNRPKGLSLIGAGFPRTGTKSIEEALGKLGFRIYDCRAVMEHGHEARWLDVTKAWTKHDNLEPMNELLTEIEDLGYSATLDTPMNIVAHALIQLRPEAQVLWSHRDNAEKWYASYVFICYFADQWQFGRPWKWIFPQISSWIYPIEELVLPFRNRQMAGGGTVEARFTRVLPWYDLLKSDEGPLKTDPVLKQNWIEYYNGTPQKLRETIGCGNDMECEHKMFLEFNVKQGWGPLLQFLNVSDDTLAQEPFPYVNERATLMAVTNVMHVLGAGFPLFAILTLYGLYRVMQRCFFGRSASPSTSGKEKGKIKFV